MFYKIGLAATALILASPPICAQSAGKVYRLGYLSLSSSTSSYMRPHDAFRQGLREHGWIEGRNIIIEYRWAEGHLDRLPQLAQELVRLKVDVIAANPTPSAIAARDATKTIPIVGISLAEPVAIGLVRTLARPGGNVTGVTYGVDTGIFGKQLELLNGVVPKVARVAVLINSANSPIVGLILDSIKTSASSLQLPLQVIDARKPGDFDGAFAEMNKERAGALLLPGDSMHFLHRARLADLALKGQLPSMSTQRQWADAGGLMSYGPSIPDVYRRAATYIDKILKGAKPADLPVEQPTKFELVINLKTAKALGLTIPASVLARADEVIQ